MTIPPELVNELLLLILSGIAWLCYRLVRALSSIDAHLGKLNGRMAKSEQWQTLHEQMDAQQFDSIRTLLHVKTGD